ncbi:septal ring lytic transglycosylase RlpA family protein [Halopseudomonas pelagia]|uniref:septal ring lytic transglycosylase RlpA family protein n=1 Tax=Halopseudomonas pelagia TaxID=553151 RepID=UPI0030DA92D5
MMPHNKAVIFSFFDRPTSSASRGFWQGYVKIYRKHRMRFSSPRLLVFTLFCLLVGCSTLQSGAGGNWVGFTESGQASFYADRHQNRKTASGELYRHGLKTAAHKTLPFGAIVKVTNVKNGRSVVVKINDRGPFVKGRIIDLSKSAFSDIGNTSAGLLDVRVEVIR